MHADFWNTWQQERLDQLVTDCLVANVHCGSVDATNTIRWARQFGTQRYDLANAAAPDGEGGSYAAGFTNFSLDGQAYHHRYDAFLTRYDADGDELWTRQFGTNGTDQALAISVSGTDVYVVGSTDGRFPKQKARGGADAFVARFDADGRLVWLEQFGTHRDDEAAAISASPDAIVLAGTTRGPLDRQRVDGPSDAFVMRLDPDGLESWTKVFGGDGEDRGLSVALREGQVFLAGTTQGLRHTVADQDGFVAGFDPRGRPAWSYPLGESDTDAITSIVPRAEGVYFAGWTSGTFLDELPAGGFDAVIGKLRVDGGPVVAQAIRERDRRPGDRALDGGQGSVRRRFHDRRTPRRHTDGGERRLPPQVPAERHRGLDTAVRHGGLRRGLRDGLGPEGRGRRRDHARGVRRPDERR